MKIPPLPTLAVVTVAQICLAGAMFGISWSARATHRRTADNYAVFLHMQESAQTRSDARPFVRLASKEASGAESSFESSALLTLSVLVLGGVQLWLLTDVARERRAASLSPAL
jgi:hypothetical protein